MEEDSDHGHLEPMVIMVGFRIGVGEEAGEIHSPFAETFPGYQDGGG